MQISKWGNSLAIRLPAEMVKALNLKAGDKVNIQAAGPGQFIVEHKMTREEAIAALRNAGSRIPLPPGYKFNREEANAR
ncbi:MAG TPA: AbrB/MazE/SpoVT family DNA-binding domain-containing protein [Bryobacteraceae bacterium]|jgi:antitoxin MazE|nr:AbrB/MazE/SpoVT family DNA-binding domain-containing protein [Bryobacteraceae bacterium]